MDKPIKKITSFKRLPAVAPPSKPENVLASQSVAPAEKMSGKVSLTEFERQALSKLGVEGDVTVLPANIAEKIESVGVGLGKTINFDDLPEDKKKEIAEFIKQAPAPTEDKPSNNFETIAGGVKIPKPVIIDDLEDQAKKESTPDLPPDLSGPAIYCPHCGWDTRNKDLTEVTPEDKVNFVQSILGNLRFKKVYSLFGGNLHITFRTLTTSESDMAYKQIIIDAQKDITTKVIGDTSFYWKTLMAYRAMMAVEKVESNLNVTEVPPISEIEADEATVPNTKIFALFDSLVEQIMPTEAMRNAIAHTYNEFNSLCEKLQSMAESKDFWNAIK
jgi:hypothetical protein